MPSSQLQPLIAAMILTLLASCQRTGAALVQPAPVGDDPTAAVYDGTVTLDPDRGHIDGSWTLRLARSDSVVLLLNAGLSVTAVTGADVARHSTSIVRGLRQLVVHAVPRTKPDPMVIQLAYDGHFAMTGDGINRLTPDWVELAIDSFWYPVVGDFAHGVLGQVRVVLPSGYRLVASGASVERRGDTTTIRHDRPLPDFALAASPRLQTSTVRRARIHDRGVPAALRERIGGTTAQCVDYLNARYGARVAIPDADVVLAPRGGPGYARHRYVVITVGNDTVVAAGASPSRLQFICHEFAHFWSTGALSSGPDNWLNEGFAEFVSGRAVRTLLDEPSWNGILVGWRAGMEGQGPVWTPASTTRPSAAASYRKAPALLAELENRIGAARMDAVLRRFMTEPLRTTPQVLDMIAHEAGREHGDWFRAALGR
jgi:hypothetical protein